MTRTIEAIPQISLHSDTTRSGPVTVFDPLSKVLFLESLADHSLIRSRRVIQEHPSGSKYDYTIGAELSGKSRQMVPFMTMLLTTPNIILNRSVFFSDPGIFTTYISVTSLEKPPTLVTKSY